MARHKGKPSGINKSESITGIPADFQPSDLENDKKLTEEYTENDEKLSEKVRQRHPNRNVDKPDATNAHGYKN